jgi:hypothetical protein
MSVFSEYIIVDAANHMSLMKIVNEKIGEGYEPYGNIVIDGTRWYQALTK